MEQGERRERVVNSELALNAENLRQLQRKGEWDEAEYQKRTQARPWMEIASTFYGGPDGAMAKRAEKQMQRLGLLNEVGGQLTYTIDGAEKAQEHLYENKTLQIEMLQIGMDESMKKIRGLNEELANKPGDEKLMTALKQAQAENANFVGLMDVANKNFKTPAEEKAEADKLVSEKLEADREWQLEQEKLGQTDRLRDETERHNRAMEVINKAKSDKSTSKSGENKKLKELRSDIMSVAGKLHSVRSGQDITSEAMGSEKDTVVKNLEQRLDTMLKQFKKMGGDPSELGFREGEIIPVDTIIVNPKTKERLRWDGAEWVPVD
jgi:hypothetical protein